MVKLSVASIVMPTAMVLVSIFIYGHGQYNPSTGPEFDTSLTPDWDRPNATASFFGNVSFFVFCYSVQQAHRHTRTCTHPYT
jgi:hypothetical protein